MFVWMNMLPYRESSVSYPQLFWDKRIFLKENLSTNKWGLDWQDKNEKQDIM